MATDNFTLRGKKVLICEDEGLIQMQWRRMLEYHGAAVVGLSPSGDECVDLALKSRPDIVLMDVSLEGVDGWEASKRILREWDTCIVVVTAQPRRLVEQQVKNIRVSGFIEKPVTAADFINELTKCYRDFPYGNGTQQ